MTSDIENAFTGEVSEASPSVPEDAIAASAEVASEPVPRSSFRRRTYLAAAALGSAAFNMFGGSPLTVLAHTDDKSACTAGDIEVTGGDIINEPCVEGVAYTPIAKFQVTNQNNASRNCVTLHLGNGPAPFAGKDFLLTTNASGVPSAGTSNIAGLETTQTMYAKLDGTLTSGSFHTKLCYPGSVVAFRTAGNQNDATCDGPLTKYPGGQCRRQEICIVPFAADLTCVGDCAGKTPKTVCDIKCGESLYLLAEAVGHSENSTSNGTYTFELYGPDGQLIESKTGTSPQCFTVANPAAGNNQTYTIKAKDQAGCIRSDSVTLNVQNIDTPILALSSPPDCDGNATISVTNCDSSLTYEWKDGGTLIAGASGCTLSQKFATGTHSITVTAKTADGSCTATSAPVLFTVNPPVVTSVAVSGDEACNAGVVTFKASATGGNGSYTFEWKVNGSTTLPSNVSASGDTLTFRPQVGAGGLDTSCYAISVQAFDTSSLKCAGNIVTKKISQCVASTVGDGTCS
ncbi:MAG: hypothetical protein HY332_15535 [Chloroflexi bacterium]|nr:hypothetical protein [Chloroflexota bacterium]